ncbi:MAG: hypothetical protein EXQ55_03555 [Acidobacteria bacterium]|nr:hypothetical protein [Acidobacteriota bacterium]
MKAGVLIAGVLTVFALVARAVPAHADERFALIVSGVSGGEKFADNQKKWVASLESTLRGRLGIADDHISTLSETGAGAGNATKEGVAGALAVFRQRVTENDTLLIVLMGHGTSDGAVAKFNLVGPDMGAKEWKQALAGIPARIIFVNTTSSSFPFVEDLSAKNRIVIAATESAAQRYDTTFPEFFIEALDKVAASDSDKSGRLSVWEAFVYASQAVKVAFDQKGTLVTERAVIDDNGDGVGKQASGTGTDGPLAKTTFFDAEPASSAANPAAALEKQRIALEGQIEDLKGRKAQMAPPDYDAQLEKLAIDLARISAQIRSTAK